MRRPVDRKPAHSAAAPISNPRASGRARAAQASAANSAASSAGSHSAGSLVGGEIERHAGHRRDRDPEEEAPLLDLAGERAGEIRPPIRRPGEPTPRQSGGGRLRPRACPHGRRDKHREGWRESSGRVWL